MAAARETALALAPHFEQIERAASASARAQAGPLTTTEKTEATAHLRREAEALGISVKSNAGRKVMLNQIRAKDPDKAKRLEYLARH